MKKTTGGFTIVELLVVIVVIAILAAITIVAYNGIQNRAQMAGVQADMNNAMKSVEVYKATNDAYPASITDCPTPASSNICVKPSGSNTYTYRAFSGSGSGYAGNALTPTYELTSFGTSQFLYSSPAELAGPSEFLQYTDLAPIINKYGLVSYKLTFDIKSANIASQNTVLVYMQNGSGAKYEGPDVNVPVTTSYSTQTITFTPSVQNSTLTQSILAFWGGAYGNGNIATVKNVRLQKS
jgi:prepilin-type N-terminal cleavage/methylation domain-containing protein